MPFPLIKPLTLIILHAQNYPSSYVRVCPNFQNLPPLGRLLWMTPNKETKFLKNTKKGVLFLSKTNPKHKNIATMLPLCMYQLMLQMNTN